MDILNLISRNKELFIEDICDFESKIQSIVQDSKFLIIGGAGSIGKSVTFEIFKRCPKLLHVVDIDENQLVELVRDLRSSIGYIKGDFKTFVIDVGSSIFDKFYTKNGPYDYILNLSALKHVRSEKDPYTLMRMIEVNILNTIKTIKISEQCTKKYFCVSTDKAANPVNLMGASKRIMEIFLQHHSNKMQISTARFANVAFSAGSLLSSFELRIQKRQPIVAPNDILRYFITPKESGELCLMSCLFGENKEIFFPKLNSNLNLISFSEIANKYLTSRGYTAYVCENEDEARSIGSELITKGFWPCLFNESDTTGEKGFEEFFTDQEQLILNRFKNIGIVKNEYKYDPEALMKFISTLSEIMNSNEWTKLQLVDLFNIILPEFNHIEKGKYLDDKM